MTSTAAAGSPRPSATPIAAWRTSKDDSRAGKTVSTRRTIDAVGRGGRVVRDGAAASAGIPPASTAAGHFVVGPVRRHGGSRPRGRPVAVVVDSQTRPQRRERALIAAGADVNAPSADGTHVLPYAIVRAQDAFALFPARRGSGPERLDGRRARAPRGFRIQAAARDAPHGPGRNLRPERPGDGPLAVRSSVDTRQVARPARQRRGTGVPNAAIALHERLAPSGAFGSVRGFPTCKPASPSGSRPGFGATLSICSKRRSTLA